MPVCSPNSGLSLRGAPIAVLDFETTGPDPRSCEPVQAAVVHCRLGDSEPEVVFNQLIQPGCAIPEGARAVHGISDEMVADAPTFAEAFPALWRALDGRVLVAFNLPFDWQVLARGAARVGVAREDLPFGALDPLVWAKVAQRYERGKRLVDVATRYGVEVDAHDAAGDAIATARIMPRLLHDLGRHRECGREPLLSVGAMWAWTSAQGIKEDASFAEWRARKGQEAPTQVWKELVEGWWP
jgi:DNA polymerase III epsilon subunit-like protein